jgi:aminoglycoside phosphotransferase (APT) family kinase protein
VSRTELNTGTTAVRPGLEIDTVRLQAWMSRNVGGFEPPFTLQQFKGGQSSPTYKIAAASGEYVLRRKPPGALLKSAHAIEREFRVLHALQSTSVPVPRVYGLCTDGDVLGTPFYVMEFKRGHIHWDLLLEGQSAAQRSAMWDAASDALTRLHRVDYDALGLGDFGNPAGYFARQLARWSEQYRYTREGISNPSMDKLISWLPSRIPAEELSAIVHGDYQFSNMVMHESRTDLVAILDWELSTIGHPLSDLAYFCRVYHLPVEHGGLRGVDLAAAGIPCEKQFVEQYLDKTRFHLHGQWGFYVAFSMFRLAAIRQGVAKRVLDGTATSTHAAKVAASAVPMADYAWALAQTLE